MNSNKEVVEEVLGCLRLFSDGTVDRAVSGPPEAELFKEPIAPHEEFIDGVTVCDQIIDPSSGLTVRIYIPETKPDIVNEDKLPLLLHFHGGGFCFTRSDSCLYYHFYTRLVRFARAVCVSVYLRQAPEHRLPAACDDAYTAYLWLGAIARGELAQPWLESHVDFKRIFLIGDSSGGNLVHQVAARVGDTDSKPMQLAGGVMLHPGFIGAKLSKSFLELPDSPLLTHEMVIKLLDLALPVGTTRDHPITCPMGPAAPPLSGLKLPPMLVVVAEMDLLRDTQLEYCEAMKKAGKEIEVLFEKEMYHCYHLNKIAIDVDPKIKAQVDHLIGELKNFVSRY